MTKIISDIFAFALQNVDFWSEFFSDRAPTIDLTNEETRGLVAAQTHVDDLIVTILEESSARLEAKYPSFKKRHSDPRTARRNRYVEHLAPIGLTESLSKIRFTFKLNKTETAVQLYASLRVKTLALDKLRVCLCELGTEHFVDDNYVSAPGLDISADAKIADVADQASERAARLLLGFKT
jgi:hypothetical protein